MSAREADRGRLEPSDLFVALEERYAHARELNTRAEAMAERPLDGSISKRFLIGLVDCRLDHSQTPALVHPVFEKILLGIRSRLTANGCDLLLSATRSLGSGDEARRISVEQTIDRGADALIAWGMGSKEPEVEPIVASGLPAMFIDVDVLAERTGYVMSSNIEAMAAITRHLYEAGYRRIAHIAGHLNARPGPDRLFGYRSELDRLGLPLRPEYTEFGEFDHTSGYNAMKRLVSLPEPPDAVTAASDSIAVGAMVAIGEAGLRIPEDIAVTGFDDEGFAATLRPSLTSVRQDASGMGTAAAEAVLRMLENEAIEPPVIVLPTELIVRESSAPRNLVGD